MSDNTRKMNQLTPQADRQTAINKDATKNFILTRGEKANDAL